MTYTFDKGIFGKQDLNLYDGLTNTFTQDRTDGTTTRTLTLNKIGYTVDVLQVYGGGASYSSSTINTAIAAISTNQVGLELDPGEWVIGSDVTFPATAIPIIPPGAVLQVATGVTVTINSHPQVGRYQWIELTGTGKVTFAGGQEVCPEWWGAIADNGTTDCTTAIQAMSDSGAKIINGRTDSYYKLTDYITVSTANQIWRSGYYKQDTAAKHGFYVTANGVRFEKDVTVRGKQSAAYSASEYGIYFKGTSLAARISDCVVDGSYIYTWGGCGVRALYGDGVTVKNAKVTNITYCGVQARSTNNIKVVGNEIKDITPGTAGLAVGISIDSDETGGIPVNFLIDNNDIDNAIYESINIEPARVGIISNNRMNDSRIHISISHLGATAADLVSDNILVCNNTGTQTSGGTFDDPTIRQFGIGVVGWSAAVEVSQIVITGNKLTRCGGVIGGLIYGAYYLRHCNDVKVVDNHVYDCYLAGYHANTNVSDFDISKNKGSLDGVADVGLVYIHSTAITDGIINGNVHNGAAPTVYSGTASPTVRVGKNYNHGAGVVLNSYTLITCDKHLNYTAVTATGVCTDTDLMTWTIPAGLLYTNDRLYFMAAGTKTGATGNKSIKLVLGTTEITVHPAANDTTDWIVRGSIALAGAANAQRITWQTFVGAAIVGSGYDTATEDLSADCVLKFTGTAAGAADTIVQRILTVDLGG